MTADGLVATALFYVALIHDSEGEKGLRSWPFSLILAGDFCLCNVVLKQYKTKIMKDRIDTLTLSLVNWPLIGQKKKKKEIKRK